MVAAYIAQPAYKEDGKYAVFADRFMQRHDQVFLWQSPFPEELFHQFVLSFSHQLHQA